MDVWSDAASSLKERLEGNAVLPGEEGWDAMRQAWNLAVDQRPAMVALPESSDDVVAIVDFAREQGLRVAAQTTGHAAAAYDALDDTVLLKTSRMNDAEVRADDHRARAGGGALTDHAERRETTE
jgi:FAD/FMN-containing dehydrogenase